VSDTDTISTEQPAGAPGADAAGPAASSGGASTGTPARRRGLTGMVLAELRTLAGELNIPDTDGMRKSELISAIKERQGGGTAKAAPSGNGQLPLGEQPSADAAEAPAPTRRRRAASRPAGAPDAGSAAPDAGAATDGPERNGTQPAAEAKTESGPEAAVGSAPEAATEAKDQVSAPEKPESDSDRSAEDGAERREGEGRRRERRGGNRERTNRDADGESAGNGKERDGGNGGKDRNDGGNNREGGKDRNDGGNNRNDGGNGGNNRNDGGNGGNNRNDGGNGGNNRNDRDGNGGRNRDNGNRDGNRDNGNRDGNGNRDNRDNRNTRDTRDDDDDDEGGGRRRGRRFRDRNRRGRDRRDGGGGGGTAEPEVRDDDVLLPVAGILDVLDNYAFVRTSGYLSGPNDVYVSLSMVRRYGLRRGDNVTGAVRQPREGEQQRQKFNPLVRVDTINGFEPEKAKNRPEFTKLTPLYPNDRLRLETESHKLTTRVIDLVMPVGKGQRALIVSPPKAGKTTIMQNIANAITTNNPECHLMVVLVDERPEEVTDMQRSVKGEVIASTFDRPPSDHTTVAELSIERAKRLVEMGHDVVVLLDNITRLGRAYNLAAPASGRILSGGVDSTALYPPKRFLGAARNIEDGGSLTIFATALVETGSTMDTVIFEEFKGTGNAELKLDRKIADKRVFPAIDVGDSGTRKEELLMSPDEHAVMVKLRRVLAALDDQQAIDLLLTQLRKTRTNIEFLMQVAKNAPGTGNDD
jgi:transcription termination factor Rho